MKKNSFLEGAFIATIAAILVKMMGVLYVIPFYAIIGTKGSILYGYGYSIYAIFVSFSTGGIAVAMSKLISEYNALGEHEKKRKAYKMGLFMISATCFISFIIIMFFAPNIATLIIGDLQGGNTIEEVSTVIRLVSSALLIVPFLSVTRGYFQGHQYIYQSSISTLLEQFVRIVVIILGSFVAINVLGYSVETGVNVAVFGAFIGALVGYLYLRAKMKHEKLESDKKVVSRKEVLTTLLSYAIPFIILDFMKSSFNLVDTFTVIRKYVALGYSEIAEVTLGVTTNWGSKLAMIVISISVGVTVSLIPNISSSNAKKDYKEINRKVNQTLAAMLFICLPMTVGLFFLAQPVWVIFYGYNEFAIQVFRIYIFHALTYSFYSIMITILQSMNKFKVALIVLFSTLVLKILLNTASIELFHNLGLPVYYAQTILTLVLQTIAVVFILGYLKNRYHFELTKNIKMYIKILITTLIMFVSLSLLGLFINTLTETRLMSLYIVILYSIIGGLIYMFISFKTGIIYKIFGEDIIKKITAKFKRRKI